MNNEELILTTIKKVYAIREATEKRTADRLQTPLLGYVRVAVGGTGLTKDQQKDITAFITASCNTGENLTVMEKISEFKSKSGVHKPQKFWLSFAGLIVPLLLAVVIQVALYFTVNIQTPIFIAIAAALVIVALAIGILLFSIVSYDADYRRDALEHEVWKAINRECVKRVKQGGIKTQKQLPPGPQERPVVTVATKQTVPRRKL
jgi:membrane-associated protease RseP (regulator of RpoE activity)